MLRGRATTSSVIHAAGSCGPGTSARPNALVVLVNTNARTRARTASSKSSRVPVTFVSTKSCRACVAMCGLCSAAACNTTSTPASAERPHEVDERAGPGVEAADVVALLR